MQEQSRFVPSRIKNLARYTLGESALGFIFLSASIFLVFLLIDELSAPGAELGRGAPLLAFPLAGLWLLFRARQIWKKSIWLLEHGSVASGRHLKTSKAKSSKPGSGGIALDHTIEFETETGKRRVASVFSNRPSAPKQVTVFYNPNAKDDVFVLDVLLGQPRFEEGEFKGAFLSGLFVLIFPSLLGLAAVAAYMVYF